jgi:hypothetical protein
MGKETDKLIDKRSDYRIYGRLLVFVGSAGLIFAAYILLQALLSPARRHSLDPTQEANDIYLLSIPLIKNGSPAPPLPGLGFAFGVMAGVGAWFLTKARDITREIRATEAEVNRQIRIAESLRERGRA